MSLGTGDEHKYPKQPGRGALTKEMGRILLMGLTSRTGGVRDNMTNVKEALIRDTISPQQPK